MLHLARSPAIRRAAPAAGRRLFSDKSSPLAGDTGRKATHLHHHMTTFLALSTPLYLAAPDSYTEGAVDKVFGMAFAAVVGAHSWIGLNYVARDYAPKVSKALMGPARVGCAALGALTFIGMGKIALNDRGGVKGCIKGLWRPADKKGGGEGSS